MPGTASEVRNMTDGWFNTWPERSYERVDGTTPQGSPRHRAPVPLSSLLSRMSLAYSPITKGLHVLDPVPNDKSPDEIDESQHKSSQSKKIDLPNGTDVDDCEKVEWCVNGIGPSSENLKLEDKPEFILPTEASSFSSIVSSLSDASPSHDNLCARSEEDEQSQRSFDCSEQSKFFACASPKVVKKKPFTGFFSKNVFGWKSTNAGSPVAGWKFLGKSFAPASQISDSISSHTSESSFKGSSQSINDGCGAQKYGDVVASSSALILHDRPASLPAKSEDEQVKHKQEYQNIVDAAKRKEEQDSKLRKKSLQRQLKHEEQLANAIRMWNFEILPKWSEMKSQRKTRDMWWTGLPPCVRGKVWRLAVENDLNVTDHLYHICATRAEERLKNGDLGHDCEPDDRDKESSMELIQLDIARTFPQLCIFQKGGPYYDILHSVLGAYVCYRPDVGYVQGMSFLAAILILNLDPPDAFICFANILNRPCLHSFFTLSQPVVEAYYKTYSDLLKENLPRLNEYFDHSGLTPDLYLLDWIYSVFGKAVNLDVACRIWDVFIRDGEEFLFQTALGILHMYEKQLLGLDFVHGAQFLTRLPDSLSADVLFKSIASIRLTIGKQTFSQVLSTHMPR